MPPGIAAGHAVTDFPVDEWRRIIDVNLTGTFLLSQAALPALLESARARSSTLRRWPACRATPYNAAYCASKGGVVMLTKSMAIELARRRVRVNAVCPSAVDTALLRGFGLPDDADLQLLGRAASPMGDVLEVEEVAAAVAYLASAEAAHVTGTVLTIDGGRDGLIGSRSRRARGRERDGVGVDTGSQDRTGLGAGEHAPLHDGLAAHDHPVDPAASALRRATARQIAVPPGRRWRSVSGSNTMRSARRPR